MWWLTKCKIKKSISVLKQWIPDLKVSVNEIGTIVQISIDYEISNVKSWNFLITLFCLTTKSYPPYSVRDI